MRGSFFRLDCNSSETGTFDTHYHQFIFINMYDITAYFVNIGYIFCNPIVYKLICFIKNKRHIVATISQVASLWEMWEQGIVPLKWTSIIRDTIALIVVITPPVNCKRQLRAGSLHFSRMRNARAFLFDSVRRYHFVSARFISRILATMTIIKRT